MKALNNYHSESESRSRYGVWSKSWCESRHSFRAWSKSGSRAWSCCISKSGEA